MNVHDLLILVKMTCTVKHSSCCYDDKMGVILFPISANYLISCCVLLVQVSCMKTTIFPIKTLYFPQVWMADGFIDGSIYCVNIELFALTIYLHLHLFF